MSKTETILFKMRNNPRGDWRIDQLKAVAKRSGIEWRQRGTSHVIFVRSGMAAPCRCPPPGP